MVPAASYLSDTTRTETTRMIKRKMDDDGADSLVSQFLDHPGMVL